MTDSQAPAGAPFESEPADVRRYIRGVLRIFALSFPEPAAFTSPRRKMVLNRWNLYFPFIGKDPEEQQRFFRAVAVLDEEGIIKAVWRPYRRGKDLMGMELSDPGKMKLLLAKEYGSTLREELEDRIDNWLPENFYGKSVRKTIQEKLNNKLPLPLTSKDELDALINLLDGFPKKGGNIGVTAAGPRLSRLARIADELLRGATGINFGDKTGLTGGDPGILCAFTAKVRLRGDVVFGGDGKVISLPSETACRIDAVETILPKTVVSIENKTTFYTVVNKYKKDYDGFIHTGRGIHSGLRHLLDVFRRSDIRLYHSGNLTPSGIRLFGDIRTIMGDGVFPLYMDGETYRRNSKNGVPLEEAELGQLSALEVPELEDTISEMKHRRVGIDQEALRLASKIF